MQREHIHTLSSPSTCTLCTVHATEVRKQIFGRVQAVCVLERACGVTCEAHECVSGSFPPTSLPVHSILYGARICKRLWSPGIDSEESISPAYVAWRASTSNRVSYRPARLRIDTWSP
jgi:hypothetical protein